MASIPVPAYLVPAGILATEPVEVTRAPEMKLVGEGDQKKPKTNENFPGCAAYSMAVEVIRGAKQKTLADGQKRTVPILDEINVTVWAASAPEVGLGDYVHLHGVMVGAVSEKGTRDAVLYVQALGVSKANQ